MTRLFAAAALCGVALTACAPEPSVVPENAIGVGVVLPFTGREAAIGRNLEQAMLLAQEDVNRAGGVGGRPIHLISRDSNSGSERGFDALLELLYVEQVDYLIGPEENELATRILPDVKGLDVFNILPGYAAPAIERVSNTGAWLRLAPSPAMIGCGMARQQIDEGVRRANAIVANDDYNTTLAAEFNAQFGHLGGESLPSVTVNAGARSYLNAINQAFGYSAERTLLIAYPALASSIVTEWDVSGRPGRWDFSPMLQAEVFLLNTPFGALQGYSGLSPTLSLPSECQAVDPGSTGRMFCARDNANAFALHFAERWDGDRPLPAAHFYYDALVLLALGLEYSLATRGELVAPRELHQLVRHMNAEPTEKARWLDLDEALDQISTGAPMRYVGAAAEYSFDEFGAAEHVLFDAWTVAGRSFAADGSLTASCPRHL